MVFCVITCLCGIMCMTVLMAFFVNVAVIFGRMWLDICVCACGIVYMYMCQCDFLCVVFVSLSVCLSEITFMSVHVVCFWIWMHRAWSSLSESHSPTMTCPFSSRGKWGPESRMVLFKIKIDQVQGLPWWLSGKESTYQCRRHRFHLWSRKTPHSAEHQGPARATTTELVL